MTGIKAYIAELEAFQARQRILTELRKEMATPVPVVRKAIRSRALDTLPKRGGLNKWVAAISVRARREVVGNSVFIHLQGGRNSAGGRSDIKRIDQGATRHPAWGRRGRGQWSVTRVTPGFFTESVKDETPWVAAADRALDRALNDIR